MDCHYPWVRGGYGLFYARTTADLAARAHFLNGLTVKTRTFTAGTPGAVLIPACPNTLCGSPSASGALPTRPSPTTGADLIMPFDPEYTQPFVHQGSSSGSLIASELSSKLRGSPGRCYGIQLIDNRND